MKTRFTLLFIVLSIFFISCDEKQVFDQYQSVGEQWLKKDTVTFNLPEIKTKQKHNMYINIRNNNDYPYNNLFLVVTMTQPNKKVSVDTLEYQMANPDGTLLGTGFSDIKENKLVYKENFSFSQKGKYKINIHHAVRQTGKTKGVDKLPGITEVGFRIEKRN